MPWPPLTQGGWLERLAQPIDRTKPAHIIYPHSFDRRWRRVPPWKA